MITSFIYLFVLLSCFGSTGRKEEFSHLQLLALDYFYRGEFSRLQSFSDSLHANFGVEYDFYVVDSLLDLSHRIQFDFNLSSDEVKSRLKQRGVLVNDSLLAEWRSTGLLEYYQYDSECHFFKSSVSNFFLRQQRGLHPGKRGLISADFEQSLVNSANSIMADAKESSLQSPITFELTFSLIVNANAVPAGEIIRCWLPYPRLDVTRQRAVELLDASPCLKGALVDTMAHQCVYLEAASVRDLATRFEVKYRYQSFAEYHNPELLNILPYDRHSELYRRYTCEESPHIIFDEAVRRVAQQIPGDSDNAPETVANIFGWICRNVIWVSALEYGIQDSIASVVAQSLEGDCGMQTMLFMALARYKGIPVRWQSGWMLHRGEENLHDWCEVYYQGIGWVPVDVTFGLLPDVASASFYVTGIDAYRLVVNHDTGGLFFPPKKFRRSEPYDFQRGEVEWRGGNLYFDQWHYHMDVKVIP